MLQREMMEPGVKQIPSSRWTFSLPRRHKMPRTRPKALSRRIYSSG
uniref:Ribosomal protein S15 n=1 Tax=Corydalis trisecta TaxID=2682942 RepID=A0A8K1SPF5_9MAGN|nr:ribosomal protein S15 [Corydalis trisecta]UFP91537.1 ribosomal protein S15 [Corydalis trisecta]UFP91538.1 ribosomal protein S15 [Corydalis trisecta]ULX45344.1 ribosomal protein S15 [Corydalis trisecta]